jgi:hypothetical protein
MRVYDSHKVLDGKELVEFLLKKSNERQHQFTDCSI